MEDLRKSVRYAVDKVYDSRISIEISGSNSPEGRVIDLSASGLSFEVGIDSGTAPAGVIDTGDFFITLHVNGLDILAGVEKIWSITKMSDDVRVYRAGLRFRILADEDRLRLNRAIEQIREMLQSAARSISRT